MATAVVIRAMGHHGARTPVGETEGDCSGSYWTTCHGRVSLLTITDVPVLNRTG